MGMRDQSAGGWIDIDIGDEIQFPAGALYERRVLPDGQIQVRNGTVKPVCDSHYLRMLGIFS